MSDYAGTILQIAGAAASAWGYPYLGAALTAAGTGLTPYKASLELMPGPKIDKPDEVENSP